MLPKDRVVGRIEERTGERRELVEWPKQPGVTGDATEREGVAIMHGTPHEAPGQSADRRRARSRRCARAPPGGGRKRVPAMRTGLAISSRNNASSGMLAHRSSAQPRSMKLRSL
jgi:hypothetical protein